MSTIVHTQDNDPTWIGFAEPAKGLVPCDLFKTNDEQTKRLGDFIIYTCILFINKHHVGVFLENSQTIARNAKMAKEYSQTLRMIEPRRDYLA